MWGTSLKRKINFHFLIIGIIAVVSTLITTIIVCYEIYKNQISDDLRSYAAIITESGAFENEKIEDIDIKDIRITLIAKDGTVIYDNQVDASTMDNHSDRPEVKKALIDGHGDDVRMSESISKSAFYYGVRLDNGTVLRISKESYSIVVVFIRAIPVLAGLAIAIILFCAFFAHFLTGKIVSPIEDMANNLDTIENYSGYKELEPIFNTIKASHERTISNAIMRQEFTANVSHELKTPLTAISGYAELIQNGMANEEETIRFSKEIRKNADRLLTLINDTIKLSELDSMASRELMEKIDLNQIMENCSKELSVNATKHGIHIEFSGSKCMVMANKDMLEEIIYNLVDNAIRYNNEGGSVFVKVYSLGNNKILSVRDTGIGISKEHQERIFERFYRVDKSRSKLTGGTGLGLAIVKHMVAKQNARLELESEVGKGTEIRVVFCE